MAAPTRSERFRPAELIGLALFVALFTGAIVGFSTREITLAGIFGGIAFIVALLILAMLALVAGSDPGAHPPLAPPSAAGTPRPASTATAPREPGSKNQP